MGCNSDAHFRHAFGVPKTEEEIRKQQQLKRKLDAIFSCGLKL